MRTFEEVAKELLEKSENMFLVFDIQGAEIIDLGFESTMYFESKSSILVKGASIKTGQEMTLNFFIGDTEFYESYGVVKSSLSSYLDNDNLCKELFKVWMQSHFSESLINPKYFYNFNNAWIPILEEINYFDRYTPEQLIQIYEETNNEYFLPNTVKNVFLF